MTIFTFFPEQNEAQLKEVCSSLSDEYVILSYRELPWAKKVFYFTPSQLPPPDDAFRVFYEYLSSLQFDESINISLIDWTSFDFNDDFKKLKTTQVGVKIVQENIKLQDFRLAPFMENLLKICYELKLPGVDRLYADNPNLIVPKYLNGNRGQLLYTCGRFLELRGQIKSKTFTGVIPIFNSEFVCN